MTSVAASPAHSRRADTKPCRFALAAPKSITVALGRGASAIGSNAAFSLAPNARC